MRTVIAIVFATLLAVSSLLASAGSEPHAAARQTPTYTASPAPAPTNTLPPYPWPTAEATPDPYPGPAGTPRQVERWYLPILIR